MKILMIGDIFGTEGRRAVAEQIKKLKQLHKIDFVIANAENTTHGRGLSKKHFEQLKKSGIDFFTFGNHTWDNPDYKFVLGDTKTVRPMNLANNQIYSAHGVGSRIVQVKDKKVRITNLLGSSVHMGKININNPVKIFRQFLNTCEKSDYHIVDFHAETTGEKKAFFLEFAGQVDVIVGTHTHVQTNDAHVFNNTAFITDLGMSGAFNSVIGAEPDTILAMYREEVARFTLTPAKGKYQLNGALINFTDTTNTVKDITPIYLLEK